MILNSDTQKDPKKASKSYKIAIFTQSLFFEVFLAFLRTHTFATKHSLIPIWNFWRFLEIVKLKRNFKFFFESIFEVF